LTQELNSSIYISGLKLGCRRFSEESQSCYDGSLRKGAVCGIGVYTDINITKIKAALLLCCDSPGIFFLPYLIHL